MFSPASLDVPPAFAAAFTQSADILPKDHRRGTGEALLLERGREALAAPAAARKIGGLVFPAAAGGVFDGGGVGMRGRVLPSSGGKRSDGRRREGGRGWGADLSI